jgi:hypothetical protein
MLDDNDPRREQLLSIAVEAEEWFEARLRNRHRSVPRDPFTDGIAEHDGPTMFARIGILRGIEPPRRARIQSRPEGPSLRKTEAGARPITAPSHVVTRLSLARVLSGIATVISTMFANLNDLLSRHLHCRRRACSAAHGLP